MGRPKKRTRTPEEYGNNSSHVSTQASLTSSEPLVQAHPPQIIDLDTLVAGDHVHRLAEMSDMDVPDFSTCVVTCLRRGLWVSQLLIFPISITVGQGTAADGLPPLPSSDSVMQPCACLSAIYLTLDNLRAMQDFAFPYSLHLLRKAIGTGSDVLQCKYCPTRFLTATQNVQLLGLLLVSLVERYDKILSAIDLEAQRCVLTGETKRFRVGDMTAIHSRLHTGTPDCPGSFTLELKPAEWVAMAKKVVRAEICERSSDGCPNFFSLTHDIEQRQNGWHSSDPVGDAPESCQSRPITENPPCLALCREAQRLVGLMKFE